MSGRASRNKGSAAELEVANRFQAFGFDVRRTPNSGGLSIRGDLIGELLPELHVEVKRCETLTVPQWLKQAEADAREDQEPIVIFRRSREPWRVIAQLDHYLGLLRSDHNMARQTSFS